MPQVPDLEFPSGQSTRPGRLALGVAGCLLAWALYDRVFALGRLPGINGDEAWYGVQLLRSAAGELVSWRTPNGSLPGPLHLALLWGLLKLLPRELWVLRVPSVLSSVAAIGVTFFLLRRRFGMRTALIGAVLQSSAPVGIVYARLGWDPSHAPLLGAVGIWCALEGQLIPLVLLFAFSLWCHPTNVFSAPFFGVTFAVCSMERDGVRVAFGRSLMLLVAITACLPLLIYTAAPTSYSGAAPALFGRGEWLLFLERLGDFFTGAASFAYTAGPPLASPGTRGAFILGAWLALLAALGVIRGGRLGRTSAGLFLGFALTLAFFAAVAGAHALEPHFERYGLVLVTPAVVTTAVLLGRLSGGRLPAELGLWAGLLMGATGLAATERGYFEALARTGSLSHETFWTGDVEPKQAAWQQVLASRPPGMAVRVAADSYWSYQPLAFLAWGTPGVTVEQSNAPYRLRPGEALYLIGFNDGTLQPIGDRFRGQAVAQEWSVPGAGRAEVLRVVRLLPQNPGIAAAHLP